MLNSRPRRFARGEREMALRHGDGRRLLVGAAYAVMCATVFGLMRYPNIVSKEVTIGFLVIFLMVTVALIVVGQFSMMKNRMPVRFKNVDELLTVYEVARWAAKDLDIKYGDQRLFYSLLLRRSTGGFMMPSIIWWTASIPVQELALLAPFIDLIIEGRGPPQNLPPEYDDRANILQRFKERMQIGGLWPQAKLAMTGGLAV
jgi:hypothetical protein